MIAVMENVLDLLVNLLAKIVDIIWSFNQGWCFRLCKKTRASSRFCRPLSPSWERKSMLLPSKRTTIDRGSWWLHFFIPIRFDFEVDYQFDSVPRRNLRTSSTMIVQLRYLETIYIYVRIHQQFMPCALTLVLYIELSTATGAQDGWPYSKFDWQVEPDVQWSFEQTSRVSFLGSFEPCALTLVVELPYV